MVASGPTNFSDGVEVHYIPDRKLRIYFSDGFVFSMNAQMIDLDAGVQAIDVLSSKPGLNIRE